MLPDEARDRATLGDLVQACAHVIEFTRGAERERFAKDRQLFSAISFQIAVIGEAVKRFSREFRDRQEEIPWQDIAGMRDRLIHGYDTIDADELWDTATRDVPELLERLRQIQAEL